MRKLGVFIVLLVTVLCLSQCAKDPSFNQITFEDNLLGPTPYYLQVPTNFPDYFLDRENRLTVEGISLGKRLFFDNILSKNFNVSCGSCHFQEHAFSDPRPRSIGTNGTPTTFHSMPLFNMAWMNEFFWDGRAKTREEQALQPVTNPHEMDLSWSAAVDRLQLHPEYPALFQAAFGTNVIDSMLVAKALVQYEMTLVSASSKFDEWLKGSYELTPLEAFGQALFNSERGDCFHCHGTVLTTDNAFHNNGLDDDANLKPGLYSVTGDEADFGKFKTPTLRNLVFTAPYMHDGRFQTIDEVIDFYSDSVQNNRNVDVLMEFAFQGGVRLDPFEKQALKAFLLTMTDSSFIENPAHGPME
jgi:cytochrome c peroxidase